MTLQAKLTLGSVVLASLMVGVISAVDLANEMQRQFEATLERADTVKAVSSSMVTQALNRQRTTLSLREVLRDPDLQNLLVSSMTASHAVIEVAVVDQSNEILLDSLPKQLGQHYQQYPDFRPLAVSSSWYRQLQVLIRAQNRYQLEQPLGPPGGSPVLYVRTIIDPALITRAINPIMQKSARVALLSVIAAVILTLLFSAVAFRPLGELRHLLDQVARGEYEPDKVMRPKVTGDEVAVMASKVSMLGQRLRGAQYEVSDLRGNIDRLLMDLEDAVFIFNREMRLVFASGSVEKFLGIERSSLTGKSIFDIFPPNTTLGLFISQASQTGRPIRNRRGPLPVPGETNAPSPIVILSVDILENLPGTPSTGSGLLVRLRDPEAQRKIGRELQTADRMAALSRVSSGVAHEVKNPLNAILLHVEVARAKLAHGDTEIEPQMEIISREILRLDRVVKTFLDFTKPVELSLSTVRLGELLAEIVELARPQAESSEIQVTVEREPDEVEVRVDRDLVKQAFLNIVVNAMQAMPEGGELRFSSFASEDTAEIRISDTGPGIPPELRDKIFRLYFTTKKEGSGIGLAMAFRIVQLHDGTIDFTSEPGRGTTFCIRLPIAA